VDLLFVEAAVNDSTNGRTDSEQLRAMEGIVRHARRAQPDIDLVMLHFVDPDKMRLYRAGGTPAVIANHERVAEHYGIPSIDLAREVTERIDAGEFDWREDFVNLHPSPFGQRLYARSMQRLFDAAGLVSGSAPAPPPARSLPAPLDPRCYQHGHLVNIDDAILGPGFSRVESWRPSDGKGTRAGFVDVPMLVGQAPGAELSLPFEGTGVGLFVAAGPDAGILEWSVDGAPFVALDLMTRWSRGLHLPWAHVLTADLDEGHHQLRLRLVESPDPDRATGAARIAHFLVHGPR